MINYVEKGIGLHQAIADAGYSLYALDGVWISNNDIEVQYIIDNYVEIIESPADEIERKIRQALAGVDLDQEDLEVIIAIARGIKQ